MKTTPKSPQEHQPMLAIGHHRRLIGVGCSSDLRPPVDVKNMFARWWANVLLTFFMLSLTYFRPSACPHWTSSRGRNDVGSTPNNHLWPVSNRLSTWIEHWADEEMTLTQLFPDWHKTPFDLLPTHIRPHPYTENNPHGIGFDIATFWKWQLQWQHAWYLRPFAARYTPDSK